MACVVLLSFALTYLLFSVLLILLFIARDIIRQNVGL